MTSTPAAFEVLGTYQNEIGNLRSHHWKHWIDLYTNCYYDCAYCVYRASGKMGRITSHPERIEALRRDLGAMPAKAIVYMGPKADIYQPLDRQLKLARRALEVFLEREVPLFIVTRSDLILRDIDLLGELAAKGLVEVSVTVASRHVLSKLEPHTPSAQVRFDLVRELRKHGIATSIHMSPILPHLDPIDDLTGLLDDAGDAGADCTYACMLGVSESYLGTIYGALSHHQPEKAKLFLKTYESPPANGVQSAPSELVVEVMSALSRHASRRSIPFACVHIPPLDTAERHGGIFRYKLPTVGDMVRHFDREGLSELGVDALLEYLESFAAVDDAFLGMVRRYWSTGELFRNTYWHPRVNGETFESYVRQTTLDVRVTNMKVT